MKTVVDLVSALKTYFLGKDKSIYEVMGQNGAVNALKNGLTTKTKYGVTLTVNDDKSMILSTESGGATAWTQFDFPDYVTGLAAGKTYKLTLGVQNKPYINGVRLNLTKWSGGSETSVGYATPSEDLEFIPSSGDVYALNLSVSSGTIITTAITINAMIRLASDTDPTYQPYAETNQQLTSKTDGLWDNMMDNGAVNLLKNKGTTQTINGVTFTVNSDGTITANGANTSTSAFAYEIDAVSDNFVLPAGIYKLTGCPSNGGESTWRLQAYKTDGTTSVAIDRGNSATFTLTEPTQLVVKIRIGGSAGSGTLTNLTFKPMLSDPSLNLSYDDYVPYAMTNRELTENINYYCRGARRKLFGLENNTSFTAKIPKSVCASYEQINIKLRGNNNNKYYDSVIFVNCTRNNDAINNSSIINNADTGVTFNASIDGDFVKIVVSGLTTYVRLELEYFNGNMIDNPLQEDWQFIAGA